MPLPEEFDAALAAGTARVGIFFRLGTPTPFRFWLGIGDCRAGVDAEDGAGEIYSGLGEIVAVPAFAQLINGTADRVQFKLAGVVPRVAQLASTEADEVKGALLRVGIGVFDARWQLVASPAWLRTFVVDYLTVERDQTSGEAVWTVSLSARSLLTGRRRPVLAYWTHHDQQSRSPTDMFCQRVALYSVDVSKAWPRLA